LSAERAFREKGGRPRKENVKVAEAEKNSNRKQKLCAARNRGVESRRGRNLR